MKNPGLSGAATGRHTKYRKLTEVVESSPFVSFRTTKNILHSG